MPDRPLTIATYAAGASLAAVTLVYVFGPTFFLDDDAANSSKSSRKRGVVGLVNPANDCFINSVLQALAGLPELRLYLIREVHQRKLDGPEVYNDVSAALRTQAKQPDSKSRVPEWRLLGLQQGLVTIGLKDVLDALNERPIYKKVISAQGFVSCVERAFRSRVSRQQQDAQEFLQIVIERLLEEFCAGTSARKAAGKKAVDVTAMTLDHLRVSESSPQQSSPALEDNSRSAGGDDGADIANVAEQGSRDTVEEREEEEDDQDSFPFEGKLESIVECLHCHFIPKSSVSTFTTLTLHVPHDFSSTTLGTCFDSMLRIEHIDDFKCDRCRLVHAIEFYDKQLSNMAISEGVRESLSRDRDKLQEALDTDPEKPPAEVRLPDLSTVPKRKITRHMRISRFPRVLAVHLSRSMWDPHSVSTKNLAKVAFPETLPLGGLLDRTNYKLHCVVTHKGGHNSGHYESFRRQLLREPFSTPASMGTEGFYSRQVTPVNSPRASMAPSPQANATTNEVSIPDAPSPLTPASSSASSRSHQTLDRRRPPPTSAPFDAIPAPGLPTPPPELRQHSEGIHKRQSSLATIAGKAADAGARINSKRRQRKGDERWWRISDESIKEAKTSDVLKMQREVYLLFYELDQ